MPKRIKPTLIIQKNGSKVTNYLCTKHLLKYGRESRYPIMQKDH